MTGKLYLSQINLNTTLNILCVVNLYTNHVRAHTNTHTHKSYLVGSSCRYEYCIPHTLNNGPPLHTVLLQHPLPEFRIQIDELVMNGVVTRHHSKTFLLVNLPTAIKLNNENCKKNNNNKKKNNIKNFKCRKSWGKIINKQNKCFCRKFHSLLY